MFLGSKCFCPFKEIGKTINQSPHFYFYFFDGIKAPHLVSIFMRFFYFWETKIGESYI